VILVASNEPLLEEYLIDQQRIEQTSGLGGNRESNRTIISM
jgi:hypothetical protein